MSGWIVTIIKRITLDNSREKKEKIFLHLRGGLFRLYEFIRKNEVKKHVRIQKNSSVQFSSVQFRWK
jgi:hypothetical protein